MSNNLSLYHFVLFSDEMAEKVIPVVRAEEEAEEEELVDPQTQLRVGQ